MIKENYYWYEITAIDRETGAFEYCELKAKDGDDAIQKAKRLLRLAERGGTEAEATLAALELADLLAED